MSYNPFKDLEEHDSTPSPFLKTRIIDSYSFVVTFYKIVELFLGNFTHTFALFFGTFDIPNTSETQSQNNNTSTQSSNNEEQGFLDDGQRDNSN